MAKAIKDPFAEREAERYDNPIPSREAIMAELKRLGKPQSLQAMIKHLKLDDEDRQEGLRRRLRAMERDGQLVFTRQKAYALCDQINLIRGTVIGHRDGFGFVKVAAGDDIFLGNKEMHKVLHGDVVLVQPTGTDRRGRTEGRVVRVLEPRSPELVGRYYRDGAVGYVVPDESRIAQDIVVPEEDRGGARHGQVVVLEITQRPTARFNAVGRIKEVLGEHMDPGMEIEIALRSHDLPHVWPDKVLQQIKGMSEEVSEADKQGRVDLRHLPLVTIDGEDARDFDDAVYAEAKASGGWRLWVAIADVSHYVRTGTPLDREAYNRGNSVYFPSQVIPMLPEILSNGLCSLNPKVDRLCMVCEMTVSESGKLSGYQFYPAVMHSKARLTYNKVFAILQGDKALREEYAPLVGHLEDLYGLYQALKKNRRVRGAIEFETEETQFIFNEQRKIEKIVPLVRNEAHMLIEECMILANVAAARFVSKHKAPNLYRVHDRPGEEKITQFHQFLGELGLQLSGGLEPSPKDFSNLLSHIGERPDAGLISTMLLRTMRQAVYEPDCSGHFGLALKAYAHFTSPIRRYPDLILHRAIKAVLLKQQGVEDPATLQGGGGYLYDAERMNFMGEQCSMTERRADEATRDVADWLKCEYMRDHVGDTLTGVISSVTNFGMFVRLNDLNIEGLVHISSLENDYYQFDPIHQALIGERSGRRYHLGDEVAVQVASVKLESRQIELLLAGAKEDRRRGKGKTVRDKLKQGKGKSAPAKGHKKGDAESAVADVLAGRKGKKKKSRSGKDRNKR
ncbi:ribonuclease R [Gallaecimonas sp. GXIMD4217]|uniref:ribonuclease R n=1 Tax=Gallaecimonas sp. GXIMD4217 TaxID=3131927 RepID=UPI00311B0C31